MTIDVHEWSRDSIWHVEALIREHTYYLRIVKNNDEYIVFTTGGFFDGVEVRFTCFDYNKAIKTVERLCVLVEVAGDSRVGTINEYILKKKSSELK